MINDADLPHACDDCGERFLTQHALWGHGNWCPVRGWIREP